MSHFTTIKTQIKDIAALEAACKELSLPLIQNAHARGYAGQTRHGDFVIQLAGPYDIAVNKQPDGTFGLTTDWWQGHVEQQVGSNFGKLLHGMPAGELISATIGFAVAAIPEGLPALVTITLALGVQQMAKRNAIIRKLPAVETLGSVTRICSDKTGTLTTNEMTVRTVVTRASDYEVTGLGYDPAGDVRLDGEPVALGTRGDLKAVVAVMAVANDAVVAPTDGRWGLVGEPTEGALATLGLKVGFDPAGYPRTAVLPFDSEHKYMATANTTPEGHAVLMVKGAPDRLLDRATSQLSATGGTEPLDRAWWDARVDELSAQGLRVLAAASRPAGASGGVDHDDLADLVLLGLTGIVDPPRPEAITAIATCHTAGIKVTMITGDHAGTATAISREMGIFDEDTEQAVTGAELEAATDDELRTIVDRTETFARTSPEHKLRLVKALQANGEIVAMTGDGVNDAPALKRADVGVAMGIKGTEATKEAADIVLADDNFATIEYAIEEGRRINDNLHKSVLFLLPTNGAQSLVVLVAVLFGLVMPLEPVQILWVNMVTAVTLSLALAYEHPFPGNPYYRNERLRELVIGSIEFARGPSFHAKERQRGRHAHGHPVEVLSFPLQIGVAEHLADSHEKIDQKVVGGGSVPHDTVLPREVLRRPAKPVHEKRQASDQHVLDTLSF